MELGQPIDIVLVGWECKGLSMAGRGKGLSDSGSGLFYEHVQVLKIIQPQRPLCWYVVENVASCFDKREHV